MENTRDFMVIKWWFYGDLIGITWVNGDVMLVGGVPTPLKNMKVSSDDDIPNIWKIIPMFQTTNQQWFPYKKNKWWTVVC